jgi:hypothetical protein
VGAVAVVGRDDRAGAQVSNKFEAMIPERALDRLAFISPDVKAGKVKLFGPSLERVFRCRGCGMDIAVGPCFEHLDPRTFVGCVCGCIDPGVLAGTDEVSEGAGRAGTTPQEVASG